MCGPQTCPDCGDKLIHQHQRKGNESSSGLGQHIHETYPKDFDWMDIDGVIFKSSRRLLRIVEHKEPGKSLSGSQRRVLPILAVGIRSAVEQGLLHDRSGVYITWASAPYGTASVAQVLPGPTVNLGPTVAMGTDQFAQFKTGSLVFRRKIST